MTMDWQQKFDAIQAFSGTYETALHMRKPGDWYVHSGMSVGGNGFLEGKYGNGTTPENAVNDHWAIYSCLPFGRYAVNRDNKCARWNGFMWRELSDAEVRAMRAKPGAQGASA